MEILEKSFSLPIKINVSALHSENVLDLCKHAIFLGLPWLKTPVPIDYWLERQILLWSLLGSRWYKYYISVLRMTVLRITP